MDETGRDFIEHLETTEPFRGLVVRVSEKAGGTRDVNIIE